jgi:hypothetical protein
MEQIVSDSLCAYVTLRNAFLLTDLQIKNFQQMAKKGKGELPTANGTSN